MKKAFGFVCLCIFVVGCSSNPQIAINNSVDVANIAVTALANTVHQACGNTAPGGDCVPGALVTRAQVDQIKVQLVDAGRILDAAAAPTVNADAWAQLESAQKILSEVSQILKSRGVR